MMNRSSLPAVFTLLVVLFLADLPVAHAQSPQAVLQRVQATYETARAVSASFTQTSDQPMMDGATEIEGSLLVRTNMFRVETENEMLVNDGETVWIYDRLAEQVIINNHVDDETLVTPDQIFFDQAERYEAVDLETFSEAGTTYFDVDLVARADDAFYSEVTIRVRDSDGLIVRAELQDRDGATMTFDLDEVRLNPPISQDEFTFEPPEGVEVVDMRPDA